MADYDLYGLSPRTFQQLAQALAVAELGPGVIVYGDGRDGGRDAKFQGKLRYEVQGKAWEGYVILQAKCLQKTKGSPKKDGDWVRDQVKAELRKFQSGRSGLTPPDYYLLITNVDLTAVPEIGTDAKVREVLFKEAQRLGLKGIDVWDGVKLRALLNNHRDIAISFGGFITVGDVLAQMQKAIAGLRPEFELVMGDYLQGEVAGADQYAKLSEAGSAAQKKTILARVFVDLPVAETKVSETVRDDSDEDQRGVNLFASQVLSAAALRLDRASVLSRRKTRGSETASANPDDGRFVLIGGPGQGKSTLGQYICQLFRAAILKDRPPDRMGEAAASALRSIIMYCERDRVELPKARRFPVRVELKSFADDLANRRCSSLMDFIARKIDQRSGRKVARDDLESWLGGYPWLLILDGLDEVPASGNRSDVLDAIQQFTNQCANRSADILVVATSRPQGYGDAFGKNLYCHRYLRPLSVERALHYSKRLVEAFHEHDPDLQRDILERLQRASERDASKRLMRSPLQITILAVLAEILGELPGDRWQLFNQYYHTICRRETQRNLALSPTLREYDVEISHLHQWVGLYLQIINESAGGNDAYMLGCVDQT